MTEFAITTQAAASPLKAWAVFSIIALTACSLEPSDRDGTGGAASSGTGGTPAAAGTASSGRGGTPGTSGASGSGGASGGAGGSGAPTAGGGGTPAGGSAGTAAGGMPGGAGAGGAGNPGGAAGLAGSGGAAGGGAPTTGGSAGLAGSAGQAGAGSGGTGGAGSGGGAGAGGGAGYSPCPTSPSTPCAVLPLGDSITEGFGSSGGGYRVELFRQALQNGQNLTFVGSLQNGPNMVENQTFPKWHEGHGGYTIDSDQGHSGISGQITDQAIDQFDPHIVLLMIGTNDINGNVSVSAAPDRLGNLIDDITERAPDALLVVATIIPVANDGTDQRVRTYNAAIPELVSSRAASGKHVMLLDNYAAFSEDSSYRTTLMGDSLHPNDAGYAVLGRSFYEAISSTLPLDP